MKRLIGLVLSIFLAIQPMTILASGNANSSEVLLSVIPQVFSAIVPTKLPVNMDKFGIITTAENTLISNTSKGPIRIDNIAFADVNPEWELVDFDDDFGSFKVDSKKLAMSFNGDKSLANGDIPLGASNLTPIEGFGSIQLNYEAKMPARKTELVDEVPANIVFTLEWHALGTADITESNPTVYEFIPGDEKALTISFKGVMADDDTVVWTSSNEAVATVANYVSRSRAKGLEGTRQCIVTAMGKGSAVITGTLKDGTRNSFEVIVSDKGIIKLEITKAPDMVDYMEEEDFDPTGMVVKAYYNNGTSGDIVDYIVLDGVGLTPDRNSISIGHGDSVVAQAIAVEALGVKHIEGNYEYSYGQVYSYSWETGGMMWHSEYNQKGWGVRVIDNTQTDYASPLTTIRNRPVTNMTNLFQNSPATTLNLINWDTSNITDINSMFEESFATNIEGLSNFNTSNVIDMESMFYDAKSTILDVSKFDTSNVTDMDGMFRNTKTTILDVSNFDTSNVTDMSRMFYGSQATSLDLSSFDTSNVTDMNGMFNRSNATILDLSKFNTSNVTDMSWMFYGCSTRILDVSNFNTAKVIDMSGMFGASQQDWVEPHSIETIENNTYASDFPSLDVSNFDTSNVTNMSSMFYASGAYSINGLTSFNTPNVTDMSDMFSYSQATSLDLSSFDTSNVINMTYIFEGNYATYINVSNFNTSKITDMGEMFSYSNAINLDLSSFDTSNVTNMWNMFGNSKAISLDLSSFNTSNVTDMQSMFKHSQATTLDLSSFEISEENDLFDMFKNSKVKNLIAKTQADANEYQASYGFPTGVTITIKS